MTANTPGGRAYLAPTGTPLPPDAIPTDGPPGNGWHELGDLADAPRPRFRRASDLRHGDTVTRVLPVDATVTTTTPLTAEWLAVFMVYPWGGATASLRADAYVTLTTPGPSFTYTPPSNFARQWARHLIDTSPTAPPAWPEHAPTPHERARLQQAGLTR